MPTKEYAFSEDLTVYILVLGKITKQSKKRKRLKAKTYLAYLTEYCFESMGIRDI